MPLLNFKKQFGAMVESGEKRQTIRAYRKDHRDPKVGDVLYFYVGVRTAASRAIGRSICTEVVDILIGASGDVAFIGPDGREMTLHVENEDWFAQRDGFDDHAGFVDFFKKTHGLPFSGLMIRWGPLL